MTLLAHRTATACGTEPSARARVIGWLALEARIARDTDISPT